MNRSMRLWHTSNIIDVKKATPFAAYVKICCVNVYIYIYTYAYIFMKHYEYNNMIIHVYIYIYVCYPPEKKHISNWMYTHVFLCNWDDSSGVWILRSTMRWHEQSSNKEQPDSLSKMPYCIDWFVQRYRWSTQKSHLNRLPLPSCAFVWQDFVRQSAALRCQNPHLPSHLPRNKSWTA